ncbi:hypothetical protein POM88_026820 [Heracleum sosnowskyi]|uniref:Uncharacterized protein n=1 Tax=Heracleum sosnowskyi TaxID=360622 RepID=A0AAD8I6Q9_9APIA|nr:hypothetical protein POM88_026820 [Heracleum sosnowskyi]
MLCCNYVCTCPKRRVSKKRRVLNKENVDPDVRVTSTSRFPNISPLSTTPISEYSKVAGDTSSDDDMFYEEDIVDDGDSCEQNLTDCMSSLPHYQSNSVNVPREYHSLRALTCTCEYCGVVMWKEERVNKAVTRGKPKFSLCCAKGKIQLPRSPPTPEFLLNLYNDKAKGPAFMRSI